VKGFGLSMTEGAACLRYLMYPRAVTLTDHLGTVTTVSHTACSSHERWRDCAA
jgi:hypothetical protein